MKCPGCLSQRITQRTSAVPLELRKTSPEVQGRDACGSLWKRGGGKCFRAANKVKVTHFFSFLAFFSKSYCTLETRPLVQSFQTDFWNTDQLRQETLLEMSDCHRGKSFRQFRPIIASFYNTKCKRKCIDHEAIFLQRRIGTQGLHVWGISSRLSYAPHMNYQWIKYFHLR